jgi:hypothetical protein
MKQKSSGFYADSLEMLLDTMCNVLGGIVFIALMVAMLAQDTAPPSEAYYQAQVSALEKSISDVGESNRMAVAELKSLNENLQHPPPILRTNYWRLPHVAETAKQQWQIVMRYGQVYPVYQFATPDAARATPNTQSLAWRNGSVEPEPGQGEPPEGGVEQAVQSLRQHARTNVYLAFWVYDDSFVEFNRAKQTVDKLGFQYGWEPIPRNTPLKVGRRGEKILPQN